MKLRDRIGMNQKAPALPANSTTPPRPVPNGRQATVDRSYQELKLRVHRELLDRIDLDTLGRLDMREATSQLRTVIAQLIDEQAMPLSQRDRESLVDEILHEVHGLGPIEPLMRDPEVSDILVNTSKQVYIERQGKLEPTNVIFRDNAHLLQIIDRIVSRVGRRVDESSPMVDARLPDGSRVNAIIPPLALDGPIMSIRRFGRTPLMIEDLVRNGSVSAEMVTLLRAMVRARLNLLVSGGTGSGKTTLLNCLSAFVPDNERIVTIEDSAELQLQQPHVVRLETRIPNLESVGEVTQRDLVRNSLRMRPDRIIVGEVRGAEALDMLQAMNTGHDGSLSTVHANAPRDALSRVETMVLMSGFDLPSRAIREQIASALNLVVHIERFRDGTRRIANVTEVLGMEGEVITMQDVFKWDFNAQTLLPTGIRPRFSDRLGDHGIVLPMGVFG